MAAAAVTGATKTPGKVGAESPEPGLIWPPVLKGPGIGGDEAKGLLALALSAVLIKGAAMLRGKQPAGSSQRVGALEKRLSQGFRQRLGTPGSGVARGGFQVNWSAELRTLLGK